MKKDLPLFVLASTLLGTSGCPTRDKYDRMPAVTITWPTANPTFTKDAVQITAAIQPALDLPIVLRLDGYVELKRLAPPAYSFEWNTEGVDEGAHTIVAEVTFTNQTVRSAALTVVVDRTKPTVSLTPAPGAANVMLRSQVQATFSESIVLPSTAASTFPLSVAGSRVATSVALDPENRVATITIDDLTALSLPATLSVSIAPTITDRAGNPLVLPSSEWSWNVPDWFKSPSLSTLSAPEMAIGGDGRPVLVHTEGVVGAATSPRLLHVSKYDGMSWIPLGAIPTVVSQANLDSFSLDSDAASNPTIAYIESNPGASVLRTRTWDGTAWQALPDLDADADPATTRSRLPIVRLASNGYPVIAWREFLAGGGEDIFLARWDGGQWEKTPGRAGFTSVIGHDLTIDSADNPVLAWSIPLGSGVSAWNGTTKAVSPALLDTGQPTVGLDQSGHPCILSTATPPFAINVLVDGAWQSGFGPVPTSNYAGYPRLVVAPDGQPVVGWFDSSGPIRIGIARWTGSRWDGRNGLFYNGGIVASEPPQIAVDGSGSIWIAWREGTQVNVWKSNY